MDKPVTLKIRAKKLGVLIKDARKGAGLTLEDCAALIGVTPDQLSGFESGSESPSLPQLEILAFNLDLNLDHFWGNETRSNKPDNMDESFFKRLLILRTKVIGVLLKKARTEKGTSNSDLAESVGITSQQLESYENGENPVPLPELEGMAAFLNLPNSYFMDQDGIVGKWATRQRNVQNFLGLSPELQDFVTKPINQPYLEVAQRLSELSAERLRALAEGLLDITL